MGDFPGFSKCVVFYDTKFCVQMETLLVVREVPDFWL